MTRIRINIAAFAFSLFVASAELTASEAQPGETTKRSELRSAGTGTAADDSSITFAGYMREGDTFKVVLFDVSTAKTSPWLSIGDTFGAYTIIAFDPATRMLSLKKGDEPMDLPLNGAVIREARVAVRDGRIVLTIANDGSVSSDGRVIALDQLSHQLRAFANADQPLTVILRTERATPGTASNSFETVRKLLEAVRSAGVTRFAFKLENTSPNSH